MLELVAIREYSVGGKLFPGGLLQNCPRRSSERYIGILRCLPGTAVVLNSHYLQKMEEFFR